MKLAVRALMIVVVLCLFFSFGYTAGKAKLTPKEKDIRAYIFLSKPADLGDQIADFTVTKLSEAMPQVPAEFWVEFRKEVDGEEIIEKMISIYDNHLTHQEVKKLTELYKTKIGRKLIVHLPEIEQEKLQASQEWGASVSTRAAMKLMQLGYQ